jgi:hypothetical protein
MLSLERPKSYFMSLYGIHHIITRSPSKSMNWQTEKTQFFTLARLEFNKNFGLLQAAIFEGLEPLQFRETRRPKSRGSCRRIKSLQTKAA